MRQKYNKPIIHPFFFWEKKLICFNVKFKCFIPDLITLHLWLSLQDQTSVYSYFINFFLTILNYKIQTKISTHGKILICGKEVSIISHMQSKGWNPTNSSKAKIFMPNGLACKLGHLIIVIYILFPTVPPIWAWMN